MSVDDYEFTGSGDFRMVDFTSMAHYIEFFKDEIPELDPPDIFGMDPKAEIAYQIKESEKMLKLVLDLQPSDTQATETQSEEKKPQEEGEPDNTSIPEDVPERSKEDSDDAP